MKKKLVAGAVTLLSVVTLAACANGTNKDIVTMKGDTITVSDFYNEIKTSGQIWMIESRMKEVLKQFLISIMKSKLTKVLNKFFSK